jgi:hypothetical protein
VRLALTCCITSVATLGLTDSGSNAVDHTAATSQPNHQVISAANENDIIANANWLLTAQLPDGAIAVWPDTPALKSISPYFGNYAAMGLAAATRATGNLAYVNTAWTWFDWYAAHEQPRTGYVSDYTIENGVDPVSTGTFDSTDAYAGTFLTGVWDAYATSKDIARLSALATGIAGAFTALTSTQDKDGLTWAKPNYRVKYLMDNAEAYGGLRSTAKIEALLGNPGLAALAARDAERMKIGVASLWNPSGRDYDWARADNGTDISVDWQTMYPDATEEAWAVAYGLVPSARARHLVDAFISAEPDWAQPTAKADFLTSGSVELEPVGYWPIPAIDLSVIRQFARSYSAVALIQGAAEQTNNAWPYTTADAGLMIIAESGGSLIAS